MDGQDNVAIPWKVQNAASIKCVYAYLQQGTTEGQSAYVVKYSTDAGTTRCWVGPDRGDPDVNAPTSSRPRLAGGALHFVQHLGREVEHQACLTRKSHRQSLDTMGALVKHLRQDIRRPTTCV